MILLSAIICHVVFVRILLSIKIYYYAVYEEVVVWCRPEESEIRIR